jgi:DNA-binding transcriptional regulator LsrR (DeoR family)
MGEPGRPRIQPDPEINRLYVQQGLTLAEIARRVHMSEMAVWRRLVKAGVPRRPPGWRGRQS